MPKTIKYANVTQRIRKSSTVLESVCEKMQSFTSGNERRSFDELHNQMKRRTQMRAEIAKYIDIIVSLKHFLLINEKLCRHKDKSKMKIIHPSSNSVFLRGIILF